VKPRLGSPGSGGGLAGAVASIAWRRGEPLLLPFRGVRTAGLFRRSHGHHDGLRFVQLLLLLRNGLPQRLLQSRLDLPIADPAAVLGDEGDQGVGEVFADGH
jgi:hypothetical protein